MWVQAYARTALLLLGHQGSGDHWLAGENPRNICVLCCSELLLTILPFCLLVLFVVVGNTGMYSSAPQTKDPHLCCSRADGKPAEVGCWSHQEPPSADALNWGSGPEF